MVVGHMLLCCSLMRFALSLADLELAPSRIISLAVGRLSGELNQSLTITATQFSE